MCVGAARNTLRPWILSDQYLLFDVRNHRKRRAFCTILVFCCCCCCSVCERVNWTPAWETARKENNITSEKERDYVSKNTDGMDDRRAVIRQQLRHTHTHTQTIILIVTLKARILSASPQMYIVTNYTMPFNSSFSSLPFGYWTLWKKQVLLLFYSLIIIVVGPGSRKKVRSR